MDPWIRGSVDPWISGSVDPWIRGSVDPWIKGSPLNSPPGLAKRLPGTPHEGPPKGVPEMPQEAPGDPRRPQEIPGGPRKRFSGFGPPLQKRPPVERFDGVWRPFAPNLAQEPFRAVDHDDSRGNPKLTPARLTKPCEFTRKSQSGPGGAYTPPELT